MLNKYNKTEELNFFRLFSNLTYSWEWWKTSEKGYVYVTSSCERITGYRPDEFYANPDLMEKIVHHDWLKIWQSHTHIRLEDGELQTIDFKIVTADGVEKWIRHICQFIKLDSGISGVRSSNTDVTIRKRMEEKLHTLAMHDPLTGLANRRLMIEHLKQEKNRSLRTGTRTSIIMSDIDLFKTFNDKYGHEQGDHLLKNFADILNKNVRAQDVVSRWGGDEFLILLPDTLQKNAYNIAQKLRNIIENTAFICNGQSVKITMSFGVSEYGSDSEYNVYIGKADENLYKAKNRGRNTVE